MFGLNVASKFPNAPDECKRRYNIKTERPLVIYSIGSGCALLD